MSEEMGLMPTLEEFLAEIRLWTTNPRIAAALEAVKKSGEKRIYVEIDGAKVYSIIKPK
ncbi:hypothetical protein GCM10007047_31810 [Cerasicoccus arenae]|uniref:Uncharacterized protein n=2 Tax=Cerasicoccus arenae TaxID=424488 RepID=A0A8J3DEQ6_9BACT|nr:hypothetical protein GCM10007047_31810 [Cerasicoccus arenae]